MNILMGWVDEGGPAGLASCALDVGRSEVGPTYMATDEELPIRQMVDVIVRAVDPEMIVLFGSRARGEAKADSDVDLLIVEREPFGLHRSRRQETARLYLALRRWPMSKDLLLYSRDEFERLKNFPQHIVGRAQREGRVLHARA